jgi:translation initiation factor 3 subunit K
VCTWEVEKSGSSTVIRVPTNKENEARSEVKSERVGMDMFGRVIRRGFEQAA